MHKAGEDISSPALSCLARPGLASPYLTPPSYAAPYQASPYPEPLRANRACRNCAGHPAWLLVLGFVGNVLQEWDRAGRDVKEAAEGINGIDVYPLHLAI